MFEVLPGSNAPLRSPRSGLVAAAVSHAAIVAVVLASHSARGAQSHPIFVAGPELWPAPNPIRTQPVPGAPVVVGPISPPDLPIITLPSMPPWEAGGLPLGEGAVAPAPGGILGGGEVWDSGIVDERPEVLSGPVLVYPEQMRQAGVQGRVVVEVV